MNFMKNIKNKMTGRNTKPREYDAIRYGIDDIIKSGYTTNDIYDPYEHKVLIETYLGAIEKLETMSFLKKGKQKKILKDKVPNISAENLKMRALSNPRRVYVAGFIGLFGARTAGALLTQDTSGLNDSLYDIDNLTSVVLSEASGITPDAAIYTGDLTAGLSIADDWENVITHPDFTPTEDFEDAFRRLYSIDPSEISNLPEELQERLKEIQDIYAQNPPIAPVAESLGDGTLIEWGNDGKDIYTAENYLDLVEKTGPADTIVNEYSISNDGRINVAVESGYEVKVHAYNDDWTKGPTGAIIELVPTDEADPATGLDSALTKENITLEDAVKGSFGEENVPKEFHIVEDKPFDKNIPPVAFATADPDEGNVMATKVGRNDNSYICVGFEPPKYNADGHLIGLTDSLTSPWGQLDALLDKYSHLFPSSGGSGSTGTDGDTPPDDGCGGGRDGGDEY